MPETLHKTHDIATPRDITPWTKADTALLDTTTGFNIMTELLKEEYSKDVEGVEARDIDMAMVSRVERVYKALWHHVCPTYESLPGKRSLDRERQLLKVAAIRADVDFFLKLERKFSPGWRFTARHPSRCTNVTRTVGLCTAVATSSSHPWWSRCSRSGRCSSRTCRSKCFMQVTRICRRRGRSISSR